MAASCFPFVVERASSGRTPGSDTALEWARERNDWIRAKLLEHGALLIHDSGLRTAEEFEAFCRILPTRFARYTRGGGSRTCVHGNVYTSTDLPAGLVIPPHCELAYAENYPRRLLFFCMTAPRRGGETVIVDVRRVFKNLRTEIRDRFVRDGVRYLENVPGRTRISWGRTWQRMFETDDRMEVMTICRDLSIDATWREDGTLRLCSTRPATLMHPDTGEIVWFNSANLYHDSYSSEAWRSGRYGVYALSLLREAWHRAWLDPEDFGRQSTFGDGRSIPRAYIEHIRDVLWKEAVLVRWRPGDILLVDNILTAHGRMPFRGRRRILAALGAD